jgi:hypothetical protein
MMKAMQAQGIEWGEDYRHAGARALKDVLEKQMVGAVDRHLAAMAPRDAADRRNGIYRRWLLTELGAIELAVPRTRTFNPLRVVRAYARRAVLIDRMILACFRARPVDPKSRHRAPAGARPTGQRRHGERRRQVPRWGHRHRRRQSHRCPSQSSSLWVVFRND